MPEAIHHHYTFEDLNATSESWRPRSSTRLVGTTTASARDAPIASPSAADKWKRRRANLRSFVFRDGGDGVDTTNTNVKATRHRFGERLSHPLGCDCEKVQLPIMDLHVEDLREKDRRLEEILSRNPARSTGPAVIAVPSRVAQRLKRLQRVECARQLHRGPSKSWLPTAWTLV
jgi:hypothetical protein